MKTLEERTKDLLSGTINGAIRLNLVLLREKFIKFKEKYND